MFCQYKDILGKPGEGVHQYRLFDIAIADVIMTLIGALLIKLLFLRNCSYFAVLFWLFLLGVILHKIFCVDTTVNKFLFCVNKK